MHRWVPALLAGCVLPAALADREALTDGLLQIENVVHLRLNSNGQLEPIDDVITPRVNTAFFDSTGPLLYTTTAAPRWHGGDLCSFAPERPGITNTLINFITFPIAVPANQSGSTGRAIVQFWTVDPLRCDPAHGVFDTLIGGIELRVPAPGLTTAAQATIFLIDMAVDDIFAATGGLVFPTDAWGVELTYRNLDDDLPHPTWTFGFASNMANPAVPTDPINCVDPATVPLVGSSITNSTGDTVYLRDADADGLLTVGDANGCVGTPNDTRRFGATCPERIVANFVMKLEFDPPPVAAAGADIVVTDADSSGAESVTLDGSASTDDTVIASYAWSEGATSLGAGVTLATSFTVGAHTVTLTVTDEFGVTSTDQTLVTVRAGGNPCPCPGDFNGDNAVGLQDLANLLSVFGGPAANPCMDSDSDGQVGLQDLASLLSRFGSTCP